MPVVYQYVSMWLALEFASTFSLAATNFTGTKSTLTEWDWESSRLRASILGPISSRRLRARTRTA